MKKAVSFFRIFSFIILSFITEISCAQISQPVRYEKEFSYSDGYFTIIPLKDEGLVLIRGKEKYEEGKKIWEAILLNNNLEEKKVVQLPLDTRNHLAGYEYTPGHLYLLYRIGDTNKNDLQVLDINLLEYTVKDHTIKPELSIQLTHFTKVSNSIVLGGYVNHEPTILVYELETGSIKVLPGFFQKDTELVDLRVNQNNTFNAILIDRNSREQNKIVFRTFDETGKILLEDDIAIDSKKVLHAGVTSALEREDLIILGNWGERNSKQSSGFYAVPIDPFTEQKVRYFYFAELAHYLDYLNPKRAKNIKTKSLKDIQDGRVPNFINYVSSYRIEEISSGYVLLAEVYQPSSNSTNANPYYPYSASPYDFPYGYYPGMRRLYPYPSSAYGSGRAQQEIKIFESVIVAFDPAGNFLWDCSIKLDEIKSPSLQQISDFHYFDTQALLMYKKENELKIKWYITETREIEELTEKIKLKHEGDEFRSEQENESGLRYWYGNSFYVWGYQTIRNNNLKDRVREVFYINKVVAK